MYVLPLKTIIVEALRTTFNTQYPETDFANTWVSIEYPREKQNYPGIWVNYDDNSPIERAGIDHKETVYDPVTRMTSQVTRWRFTGTISLTCAALTSLERDRLYDQVVRIFAFSGVEPTLQTSAFRTTLENNDLIGVVPNYDVLESSGDSVSPGTPWGSDELIYERTLSTACIGEFVSNPVTNELALLSSVLVDGVPSGQPLPGFPDLPFDPAAGPWSPTDWH